MFTKRIPLETRFLSFFVRGKKEDCWLWTGSPNSAGYGTIRMPGRKGKTALAHRLAFFIAHGAFDETLCVCHECDTPLCVNPNHLFLGTNAENVADRDKKGRCRAGGKPGEKCGHAKLTDDKVRAIRSDNRTHEEIADSFGVARSTITNIKLGRTWKHILRTLSLWDDSK